VRVEVEAGACERRQKLRAVLMRFSLLDAAARGIRVEEENRMNWESGQNWWQDQIGKEMHPSHFTAVQRLSMCSEQANAGNCYYQAFKEPR
jgi:hypothetical protein